MSESPEVLWAGWRASYIATTVEPAAQRPRPCVFCAIYGSGKPDAETHVLWQDDLTVAILNAYPYATGHLLVMPRRHVGQLGDLTPEETERMWACVTVAIGVLEEAYSPDGINMGANLGRAAGAGIPDHLHVHALPRWSGDTNFMTSVANTRVLPEPLDLTWEKLHAAWPS